MTDWYELRELDDGLVRITEPCVNEIVKANLWWLRGTDRDLVVDTGLGVAALRQEIPALFDHEPLAVLTHAHLDHVGGAHEFPERAAHVADADALAAGVAASLYGAELAAQLGGVDVGAPFPELLINSLPYPDYEPAAYGIKPVVITCPLQAGDSVDLGGRSLTVLHLPGHTPGSIALLEERTGALYSGDIVYDGYLVDDLPESDIPSYRRSLAFLRDLDVSVVHPGHGRSFDRTRLRAVASKYLDRWATS